MSDSSNTNRSSRGAAATDTKSQEETEQQSPEVDTQAPAETDLGNTSEVVEGGESVLYHQYAGTMLVDELPDPELIRGTDMYYLLPGAPDNTHGLAAPQFAVVVNHMKQSNSAGVTFEEATAALRTKYIKGRQKDWNIVGAIIGESRQVNAEEPLTERQIQMVYEAIVPALQGIQPHWDPQIQARITQLSRANKDLLVQESIRIQNRGHVQLFMTKFNALCGQPTRQPRDASAPGGSPIAGAGAPAPAGGGIRGNEEPF